MNRPWGKGGHMFLQGMVEKKLMFREGDRFLSLAVALIGSGAGARFEQHFT
ncbi:MAG: hypothetical protein MUC41_10035 [Syntrophobacteraceae bacterium]|nr:hypothetical protein [Syntrophobacteraceae bacterium]